MKKKNIVLKDAFKNFTVDQDKTVSPSETINEVRRRLASVDMDILSHTVRIDNGRLDIPVFFSVCGKDAAKLCGTKKQMGKGATPEQAEASATMELVERFSFFSFLNTPDNFIQDRHKNLRRDALPFDAIAKSVHDDSGEAEKIYENLLMKWTWGFDLTRNKPVLVPFDWFYAINAFNGTSTGNCVEEALCQGICEIVERHVSSFVSRNRMTPPLIDPASPKDPMVMGMLEKYRRAGVHVYLSDFTLDMGIPSVAVLAYDPSTFPESSEIVWTAGTTPHPEKALSRALSETAQLAGDFSTSANYVASGLPKFASIEAAAFITDGPEVRNIQHLPDISHDNMRIEVERCIAALSRKALDVITIDTTHPLIGLPAFYTVVPGAHFRERAVNTSVGMFSTKHIAEQYPPQQALLELARIDGGILPDKYYVKFYMGRCHLALGQFAKAEKRLHEALDLQPPAQDQAAIYSYLGVCLKEMERYEDALKILKKGMETDPERTDIYNLMGFCHFKLKSHREAIACFENVIALDPGSAIDYANIASNYRELGEREKAIHFYQTALALDPTIEFARASLEKLTGSH